MELMAHSLSYLKFNELTKIECVCLYFIYASRKYKSLSHGYLNIDKQFLKFACTNRININLLSHFQNIYINREYIRTYAGGKSNYILYWKILTQIIKQSKQTLQSLTIDLCPNHSWKWRYATVTTPIISRIFNTIDSFPLLTTLNWKHDRLNDNYINYTQITKQIQTKCALLQNITISGNLNDKQKIFNNIYLSSKLKLLN
eukprot:310450_1